MMASEGSMKKPRMKEERARKRELVRIDTIEDGTAKVIWRYLNGPHTTKVRLRKLEL